MKRLAVLIATLVALQAQAAPPQGYARRADVIEFIGMMVDQHGFARSELEYLFGRARRQAAILRAIDPRHAKRERSWQRYRASFVNAARIEGGVVFWNRHRSELERATADYGVPAEVIVAIIGVETFYGRHTGNYRVIDALTTLAFDYPPRATFFRSELEQFLMYARDAGLDVFDVRGSYAGAIGLPQFMPGSYRRYAVDFDRDGSIDLRASPPDSIGSVANFLREHGWQPGERIWLPARVTGTAHAPLLERGIVPDTPIGELRRYGVETRAELALSTPVALIDLPTPGQGVEYRLGLRNFYTLTRYNRSSLYASAVADLAEALRVARSEH